MSDSYIPSRKGKRIRNRFGFIRFWNKRDALRSIITFDNTIIRGSRIKVTIAKCGRGRTVNNSKTHTHTPLPPIRRILRKEVHQNNHWRQRLNQKEKGIQSNPRKSKQVESSPSDQHVLKTLKGEANEGFLEWLNRSIVCKSVEPQNLEVLTFALLNKHCSKICTLSKFNFILTYDTVEQMQNVLSNHEELDQWFIDIKRWDRYECCETRRTWIEVFGVPPHGRNWENLKKYSRNMGKGGMLGDSN